MVLAASDTEFEDIVVVDLFNLASAGREGCGTLLSEPDNDVDSTSCIVSGKEEDSIKSGCCAVCFEDPRDRFLLPATEAELTIMSSVVATELLLLSVTATPPPPPVDDALLLLLLLLLLLFRRPRDEVVDG